uniref:NADH dehydrogenase subunit 2 n=1 Tax=Hyperolius marmoratus TaxID=476017 RepID=UPI000660F806|nr:NADH dehydrogenase subunit 2 [Hyperolius marmoratus]
MNLLPQMKFKWIIPLFNLLTLITLFMVSTYTAFHSICWHTTWLGLEIYTIAIIPMIMSTENRWASESTKFLLMQAAASTTLAYLITSHFWKTGEWSMSPMNFTSIIFISIALATKMEVATSHFWLPDYIKKAPLKMGLILTASQKIILLFIVIKLATELNIIIVMITLPLFAFFWAWGNLYFTEFWKMLMYFSMALLGWTIVTLPFCSTIPLNDLIIYMLTSIIMLIAMFIIFYKLSRIKTSNPSVLWSYLSVLSALIHLKLIELLIGQEISRLLFHLHTSTMSP